MGIEQLEDVYNPMTIKDIQLDVRPTERPPLLSWKDSAPVLRLSEYLKQHRENGIRLCRHNGFPALVFNPGLKISDINSDRGLIVDSAFALMIEAFDDLYDLLHYVLLELPEESFEKTTSEAAPVDRFVDIPVRPFQVAFVYEEVE